MKGLFRLMGVAATAAACVMAHGATQPGSMRQGAKKVQAQKSAARKPQAKKKAAASRRPAAAATAQKIPQTPFRRSPYVGALAADAQTGKVLFRDRADVLARPAIVTKLMTALLVLEDVAAGRYTLQTKVSAGPMALLQEASIIGFRDQNTRKPITRDVDTLLYALMIRSANDAAVALAEHANGTLEAFVARMNERARALGMTKTKYFNPNGLPPNSAKRYPWKEYNVTTCEDQLKLAMEIMHRHPEITKYTSCKTWVMPDGMKITNHNNVMRMDKYKIVNSDGTEAIDGLKTGYIDAGGSSVVLTGKRGGKYAIVVVLGSANAHDRDVNARSIMLRALEAVSKTADAPAPAAAPKAEVSSPGPKAAAVQVEAPSPKPDAPADASAAAGKEQAPAVDPAPAAEPQAPVKPRGGGSLGWLLIGAAFGVAGAAFFAWRWLGKDNRREWDFEDMPSEPSQG